MLFLKSIIKKGIYVYNELKVANTKKSNENISSANDSNDNLVRTSTIDDKTIIVKIDPFEFKQSENSDIDDFLASYEFYENNKIVLNEFRSKFFKTEISISEAKSYDEKLLRCQQTIDVFKEIESFCFSFNDPNGILYFQYSWSYSKKLNDYHVLSHITSKYNDLIENRDVYIEEFRIKNLIDEKCKVLDNELLHLIENNVGIIQTDIYKLYEPYMKDTVSLYLYNLDKQGVIKRTKKGRTYSLEII